MSYGKDPATEALEALEAAIAKAQDLLDEIRLGKSDPNAPKSIELDPDTLEPKE